MNINIELSNIEDATSQFNKAELSEELHEYIINKCKFKMLKNSRITLNIIGIKENKDLLSKIIHNHYEQKAAIFKKFDLVDNYLRLFLLLLGIISIFLSYKLPLLISELFLIAGWVLVWEIFYDLLFNEIKRKRNYKIYKALKNCKITFQD